MDANTCVLVTALMQLLSQVILGSFGLSTLGRREFFHVLAFVAIFKGSFLCNEGVHERRFDLHCSHTTILSLQFMCVNYMLDVKKPMQGLCPRKGWVPVESCKSPLSFCEGEQTHGLEVCAHGPQRPLLNSLRTCGINITRIASMMSRYA